MDERKRRILQAIIDDYISTVEPIGSRTIARKYDLGVSPATIRNEMADLEMLGYIEQPHTSAGRIPSSKGYRFYVDSLLLPTQITEKEVMLVNNWYENKARRIEEVFQETAKLLSRMTRNISLVLAPQISHCTFKYLQFLPLDQERAILIIVANTGFLENKVINIPEGISLDDLQKMASVINSHLAGLSFDLIKSAKLREIRQNILPNKKLFETVLELLRLSLSAEKDEKIYLGGTTQVLNQPEFRDVDRIKGLLSILEEEKLLCDILHMHDNDGMVVTIGQENKFSGIQDCSMVQATYRIDGQIVGTLAVLGPTRMDYAKVISLLDFMQQHLSDILKKYKL